MNNEAYERAWTEVWEHWQPYVDFVIETVERGRMRGIAVDEVELCDNLDRTGGENWCSPRYFCGDPPA